MQQVVALIHDGAGRKGGGEHLSSVVNPKLHPAQLGADREGDALSFVLSLARSSRHPVVRIPASIHARQGGKWLDQLYVAIGVTAGMLSRDLVRVECMLGDKGERCLMKR